MIKQEGQSTKKRRLFAFLNPPEVRIAALRRFALSITAFSLLGYFWLGFEASAAVMLSLIVFAYASELALEFVESYGKKRKPAFLGGIRNLIDFLLPAHIAALSTHFLIYTGRSITPALLVIFISISSKHVIKAPFSGRWRHFMNPSNFGICCGLFFFPESIGPAPMYHFTANVSGVLDVLVPAFLVSLGLLLNGKLTRRLPLILSWLFGLAAQAVIRGVINPQEFSIFAGLAFLTGAPVLLFSFFMISDPGTTPQSKSGQLVFGFGTALIYGLLVFCGVNLALFFCLAIACAVRGIHAFLEAFTSWAWGSAQTYLDSTKTLRRVSLK